MFELKIQYSTIDQLQDAVLKLGGDVNQMSLPLDETVEEKPKKKTKAAAKKEKTKAATKAGLKSPKKPAAVAEGVSLEALKEHILSLIDPSEGGKIKEYVGTFGVTKISDLSDDQRQEAFDGAEEFFQGDDEADPMA